MQSAFSIQLCWSASARTGVRSSVLKKKAFVVLIPRGPPAASCAAQILQSAVNPLGLTMKQWLVYFSVIVCIVAVLIGGRRARVDSNSGGE